MNVGFFTIITESPMLENYGTLCVLFNNLIQPDYRDKYEMEGLNVTSTDTSGQKCVAKTN